MLGAALQSETWDESKPLAGSEKDVRAHTKQQIQLIVRSLRYVNKESSEALK